MMIILIGSKIEMQQVEENELEDPDYLFKVPEVCGFSPDSGEFKTFSNESSIATQHEEEEENSWKITHCGECSDCSTVQDLDILNKTRNTLTETVTNCALAMVNPIHQYGFGREGAARCMKEEVGFTKACEECWIGNIECTFSNCMFTCIKSNVLIGESNNNDDDELNDCLYCDEVMCGEKFTLCAGANRRRAGIESDIDRDDGELCESVDQGWLQDALSEKSVREK